MKQLDYVTIRSREELLEAWNLADAQGRPLRFLAGGTDLMVELRSPGQGLMLASRKEEPSSCLLGDLSGWAECKGFREEADGSLYLGALCTHAQLALGLPQWAAVLAQAARSVGSPQIRARGTVGGNCANGAAAADTPPALVLLNAKVQILRCEQGRLAESRIPLAEYLSSRDEKTLLLGFWIPRPVPAKTRCFYKQGKRSALAISTVSMAAEAAFSALPQGGMRAEGLRFVTGAVTSVPFAFAAREALEFASRGACMEAALSLAEQAVQEMNQAFGYRASRSHKQRVIAGLLYEFLTQQGWEALQ